jgi:nitrogen-specific signal transduction histidine kinase/CheY-like chemotaxis protein
MNPDDHFRAKAEELETRNRELEKAREAADEANRLKSEFLAIASHELRTPLNAILGSLSVIQNGLCDSHEEELGFVRQAYDSSQHLLTLIDNLLDLDKIESGKLHAAMEPVSLRALFDAVKTRISDLARQKGLRLSFEIAHPTDLVVRGDEVRLLQILLNLAGNAIKFTMKGEVMIRALARPEKGHAAVLVQDTGVGIAPVLQSKLFRSFVQADGSTTRKFGGAGLGLAISRKLIEQMGGTLSLCSEGAEKGTTLTLTIPLHTMSPRTSEGPPAAPTDLTPFEGRPTALVVEDDAEIRKFLGRVLGAHGYRTVGVETADEALAVLAIETPALITLDIGLPSNPHAQLRTGWNLLRVIDEWIENNRQALRPGVVIISGHDDEVRRLLMEDRFLCAPRIVSKPFTVQELLEVLPPMADLTSPVYLKPGV